MKRLRASVALLLVLAFSPIALGSSKYGPTSGGGGGVTSVSGTAPVVVTNPTTTPGISVNEATPSAAGLLSAADKTTINALGTAATHATGFFAQVANNLSDLANAATSRTNLGLVAIAASGSASDLSAGTLPAGRFPALTGDCATSAGSLSVTCASLALTKLATQADQTIVGNGSGGSAAPAALTISTATGLVATGTTLKATLTQGVSGGQTIVGGTGSGDGITYSSTSHATKGKHIWGSSTGLTFDEGWTSAASTPQLYMGAPSTTNTSGLLASYGAAYAGVLRCAIYNSNTGTATATALELQQNAAQSGATSRFWLLSANYTTSGVLTANSSIIENSGGNMVIGAISAGSDTIIEGSGRIEKFRIGNSPTVPAMTVMNIGYVSFTSSTTKISQTAGSVFEWGAVPPSQASATSLKMDAYKIDATTATITGTTAITTATGVNWFDIEIPTYTDASAVTITNAATFVVKGAPAAAGSVTITNTYAMWVQAGTARFDGDVTHNGTMTLGASTLAANNTVATALSSVGPTGSHTTVQEWMQVIGTGGVNRWAPLFVTEPGSFDLTASAP
jgi:hypothetical protein